MAMTKLNPNAIIDYSVPFYKLDEMTMDIIKGKKKYKNKIIYYSTIDDTAIDLNTITIDAFNANIVADVYENGQGFLLFDNEVNTIGDNAFDGYTNISTITLPDSVTTIGNYAFFDCENMEEIIIPDSVVSIGTHAFCNCAKLSKLPLNNTIKYINEYVFSVCLELEDIKIPDNIEIIEECAFIGCSNLKTITLGNGLKGIKSYTFEGCSSLQRVYANAELPPVLGDDVFTDFAENFVILVPDEYYDNYIQIWSNYKDYIHPISHTRIYYSLNFGDEDMMLVGGVDSFDANIISNTYETGEFKGTYFEDGEGVIEFDGPITRIGNGGPVFFADILSNITIPDSVTDISPSAFDSCHSVSFYGKYATDDHEALIKDGNLIAINYGDAIILPNSVTHISCAFHDGIKLLICNQEVPPTYSGDIFKYSGSDFKILVPTKYLDVYKEKWSEYADNIISVQNNQIIYTSSDGNVIEPSYDNVFGANIVSNTYENGCGVIEFDGDVTKIGNDALIGSAVFMGRTSLTSITIPDSVTSIGKSAFNGCTSLTSVTIPDSVTSIGGNAFEDCTSLTAFYGKFATEDNCCLIVNEWFNAFAVGCGATKCTIPDGVIYIGDRAFKNCASLTSITIPNSVTSIGHDAFNGCTSLINLTIPDNVIVLAPNTFFGCSSLINIYCHPVAPPTITGPDIFDNTHSCNIIVPLESIEAYKTAAVWSEYADNIIPMSTSNKIVYTSSDGNVVTPHKTSGFGANIISNIYENGYGIIEFDGDVTKIGSHAFYLCTSLTSIIIPDSVSSIGYSAFYSCDSMTSVTIPDSVTSIEDSAFCGCASLTAFYGKFASEDNRCLIVDGVLNAFAIGCGATKYTIPNSVTSIGYMAFDGCRSLTSVIIPNSVIYINHAVFSHCTSLISVTIPDSVTSIGGNVFDGCISLTSITIPNSVTSINTSAFSSCFCLTNVYCQSITPPTLGSSVFGYNSEGRIIYVPIESVETYKTAEGWSEYADSIYGYDIDHLSQNVILPTPKSNQIIYTTTLGDILYRFDPGIFGANIISNTYENGYIVIEFDGDVTKIGNNAFHTHHTEPNQLTRIIIPDSVTSIEKSAFYGCIALTDMIIPNSVTYIDDTAFIDSPCKLYVPGELFSQRCEDFPYYKNRLYPIIDEYDDYENIIENSVSEINVINTTIGNVNENDIYSMCSNVFNMFFGPDLYGYSGYYGGSGIGEFEELSDGSMPIDEGQETNIDDHTENSNQEEQINI